MMARFLTAVSTLLLTLTAIAGPASAHTTAPTSDGKYLITVGNLNEPVTTFMKTGLDLIIRANNTARTPISGVHLTLNATLIAPDGKTLTQPLKAQFGVTGSYTFTDPYYLTQSGVYHLAVKGRINTTDVDIPSIVVGTSAGVGPMEDYAFPDSLSTPNQLMSRIINLENQNAQLKSELDAMKANSNSKAGAPGLDGLALLGLLAVVALGLARRVRA